MNSATSFDDVAYFDNQFRGDLIVTPGVLYYFPNTNVAAAKLEKKERPTEKFEFISHLFGLPGVAFQLVANGLFGLSVFLWRTLKISTNQPKLRESGLWRDGESSLSLQQRLDAHITANRNQSGPLISYQYSLPQPMRFNRSELRNLTVKLGSLRFDTEFDRHDFGIGFRRQKLLRDVLWEAGFLNNNDAQQIVGRERRGRVSHHDWSSDA